MRAIFFLALIFVFLISACVNFEGSNRADVGIPSSVKSTEDILVKGELSNSQVKEGLNTSIKFTVTNKQQFDLRNFNLNAYDLCDFVCDKAANWDESLIRPNRTKDFVMNCKAPEVEMERQCTIKFSSSYEAGLFQTHDVYTITESEYATGKTKVSPSSTTTKSPLKITATWSDPQPFVNLDSALLYLDYEYSGDGIIEKLREKMQSSEGDISLIIPKNLGIDLDSCIDFEKSGDAYTLKKDLLFIEQKAKRSTCKFIARATQPIESGKLFINATFKYKIDSSMPVTILPRKSI